MNLCPFIEYKDALGVPEKGIHSYRFLNVAIVDYILTILAATVITYYTKIPLVLTTITILVIAIFIHMMFDVETNAVRYLGLSCK